MATVTQGYTWTSGETVTPTKLNSTATPTVVVADNEVTTAKILDGAVTDAKLASGIDASKITTGTLPIARIADAAVTQAKLETAILPIGAGQTWQNVSSSRAIPASPGAYYTNTTGRPIAVSIAFAAPSQRLVTLQVGDPVVAFAWAQTDVNASRDSVFMIIPAGEKYRALASFGGLSDWTWCELR